MALPQRLQEYRKQAGISQEELAGMLGVSRQSVSKWEQGLSFPETEKLIELSSMMGITVDSLLKDADGESMQVHPQAPRKKALLPIVLGALLAAALLVIALLLLKPEHTQNDPPPLTTTTRSTEAPTTTTSAPEPSYADVEEPGFETSDLTELRRWFFDFARQYRLDYMPAFTFEEGAPEDAAEYLYWAYAVGLEGWGENKGKMSRSYVEERVWTFFRVTPGQHRALWKSWDYDEAAETYTAWPESLKSLPYFLLESIETDGDGFTVHALCYESPYHMEPGEEDDKLRESLLGGSGGELIPSSRITVSFYIDRLNFGRPVFTAFTEEALPTE